MMTVCQHGNSKFSTGKWRDEKSGHFCYIIEMKLKLINSEKDFVIYYLSRFLENEPEKFFIKSASDFDIDLQELKALNFDKNINNELVLGKKISILKPHKKLLKSEYNPISKDNALLLKKSLKTKIQQVNTFLEDLFGSQSELKNIKLTLIPTEIIPRINYLSFPASVHEKVPNKIYLVMHIQDNLENKDILLMYLKTTFHEFSHVFLNLNQEFSDILRAEWIKNYKNINPREYRKRIKELIASSLFYYKDFGFAYSVLGLRENLKEKEDSLKKNKYRKMTFDFLEELKNSKDEKKLEKMLPVFIEELVKEGLFL